MNPVYDYRGQVMPKLRTFGLWDGRITVLTIWPIYYVCARIIMSFSITVHLPLPSRST